MAKNPLNSSWGIEGYDVLFSKLSKNLRKDEIWKIAHDAKMPDLYFPFYSLITNLKPRKKKTRPCEVFPEDQKAGGRGQEKRH